MSTGGGDLGDSSELDESGVEDDAVALHIDTPAAGPAGELRVVTRSEDLVGLPRELAEALEHHRLGRHVDPQGQRLGGEDHPNQALQEQLLDRLLEGRHHTGVMGGDPRFQLGEPAVVSEDRQIGFRQVLGTSLRP